MTEPSAASVDQSQETLQYRPFTPSWIDWLASRIRHWPGSAWQYYFGLWLLLFLFQTIVLWLEGAAPPGSFLVIHAYHAGAVAFLLLMIHILDDVAGKALQTLRPALKLDQVELQELHFRLSNLPAAETILSGLVALLFVFIAERISGTFQLEQLQTYSISSGVFRLVYLLAWWNFGSFLYHTIYQLRLINRIYTQQTRVNLFHIKPLYAFSNLSALTAVSMTVVPYGWWAVNPDVTFNDPITIVVYLLVTFLAILSFLWPQWGIHRLQLAEKDRLIDEANQRFEVAIRDLHEMVDRGEFDKASNINSTLASLNAELSVLRKIPTWPWQPDTLRWLITALVLPLGLWLLQNLLQRLLGD